jgi:hypothetical protein
MLPLPTKSFETVADDPRAADSVEAWMALELDFLPEWLGERLFRTGVPCRRYVAKPADVRPAYIDNEEEAQAAWDSPLTDNPIEDAGALAVEDRVFAPAQYGYVAPRALNLPFTLACWAYKTFKATEFDSMYRLRGEDVTWGAYVEEIHAEAMLKRKQHRGRR